MSFRTAFRTLYVLASWNYICITEILYTTTEVCATQEVQRPAGQEKDFTPNVLGVLVALIQQRSSGSSTARLGSLTQSDQPYELSLTKTRKPIIVAPQASYNTLNLDGGHSPPVSALDDQMRALTYQIIFQHGYPKADACVGRRISLSTFLPSLRAL